MSSYQSTWRATAAPIIARVIADNAGKPESDIRRALKDAYPFGPRQYHPYKIWLSEIKAQLGGKRAAIVKDVKTAFLGPRQGNV